MPNERNPLLEENRRDRYLLAILLLIVVAMFVLFFRFLVEGFTI